MANDTVAGLTDAMSRSLQIDSSKGRPNIYGQWVLWDESLGNISDLNFRFMASARWLPLRDSSDQSNSTDNASTPDATSDGAEDGGSPLDPPMMSIQGEGWVFQRCLLRASGIISAVEVRRFAVVNFSSCEIGGYSKFNSEFPGSEPCFCALFVRDFAEMSIFDSLISDTIASKTLDGVTRKVSETSIVPTAAVSLAHNAVGLLKWCQLYRNQVESEIDIW